MRVTRYSASRCLESHVACLMPPQGTVHYCWYFHRRTFTRDGYGLADQTLIPEEAKLQSIWYPGLKDPRKRFSR